KLEEAKNEVLNAIQTTIRYRELAITQYKGNMEKLKQMNKEVEERGLAEPQQAERYGLDADHF
ncbi:MAG: hypothetical protein NTW50_05065, partial [Candidatus Berkelbacteria bacterium]|nr:hypothetical protein [Candidatus Berkelbacteria bacterium]